MVYEEDFLLGALLQVPTKSTRGQVQNVFPFRIIFSKGVMFAMGSDNMLFAKLPLPKPNIEVP